MAAVMIGSHGEAENASTMGYFTLFGLLGLKKGAAPTLASLKPW
jgi:hypothetical protein